MTTEDERLAFIASICTDPGDDTPRLVFADWLQERGEEDLAEFIRLQVELANLESEWDGGRREKHELRDWLKKQEFALVWVRNYRRDWFPGIPDGWPTKFDRPTTWASPTAFVSRGFVSRLSCDADTFLKHADALIWHPGQTRPCPPTAQPITAVNLTAAPTLRLGGVEIPSLAAYAYEKQWPGVAFTLPSTIPEVTSAPAGV